MKPVTGRLMPATASNTAASRTSLGQTSCFSKLAKVARADAKVLVSCRMPDLTPRNLVRTEC